MVSPYLCYTHTKKLSGIVGTHIRYTILFLRNRHGAALFHYRNCAEITILCVNRSLMCAGSKLSGIVGTQPPILHHNTFFVFGRYQSYPKRASSVPLTLMQWLSLRKLYPFKVILCVKNHFPLAQV